jgi:hypothetical protein
MPVQQRINQLKDRDSLYMDRIQEAPQQSLVEYRQGGAAAVGDVIKDRAENLLKIERIEPTGCTVTMFGEGQMMVPVSYLSNCSLMRRG